MLRNVLFLFFSFRGRINRRQWWLGQVVTLVLMALVAAPLAYLVIPRIENAEIVVFLYLSAIFLGTWTNFAINIKRLHDRNRTGWWQLLYFICISVLFYSCSSRDRVVETQEDPGVPFLFFVAFIYPAVQIVFLSGDKKKNRYGPPPQSLKEWWDG